MPDGRPEPDGIRYPFPDPPAEGAAVEVAKGVLWLRLPLPMKLDHVNAYALDDGDGWTLFDTGFDTRRTRAIWERLLSGPLAGKPVRRVIASHHHPDHIGLAGWFQRQGAALWTTRTAWLFARMLTLDEQPLPVAETLEFWRRAGMDADVLAARAQERPFNFADIVAPLPLGFHRIRQGDILHAAGRNWEVHVGNGHAPEQATLWSRDCNLVLGADQLLPSISPNLGVYATEPEADPVGDWLESCAHFQTLARAEHLVLPGHKLPFTGLPLRLQQKIDNHLGALKRLEAFLDQPRRGGACFPPLFRREIGAGEYGLALVETIAHLNHLCLRGRARRWMGDDGAWRWQACAGQSPQ
ncbi:MBL fold metallo-hydrolase [Rhodobacteraceae bacterium 2376]|uniref:MBL fold metallo-hydrolase n=1 Tax=Rhabdonatronobacter sediminivivens TaxID=2743469 RepID=A0A7Z0KWF2_9RHOB|nr:MBL fold metallo-hydrolase [Rhabdonatronobacter sediminivivens]NYS23719.1 MBL fold metallo-hydrolase [Rhabdonatronobacter sediminivivens]